MAFHRALYLRDGKPRLCLGITSGNIARLRKGPIGFDVVYQGRHIPCVLRLDDHPVPLGVFVITLTPDDLRGLLDDGLIEFSGGVWPVVCVFGRTPRLAAEAMAKVVGE